MTNTPFSLCANPNLDIWDGGSLSSDMRYQRIVWGTLETSCLTIRPMGIQHYLPILPIGAHDKPTAAPVAQSIYVYISRRSNFKHPVLLIVGSSSQTGWHKRISRIAFLLYIYPGQRLFLVNFGIDIKLAGISNLERGRDVSVGRGRTHVTDGRDHQSQVHYQIHVASHNHGTQPRQTFPTNRRSIPMPLLNRTDTNPPSYALERRADRSLMTDTIALW
jgi:hypothetical protein